MGSSISSGNSVIGAFAPTNNIRIHHLDYAGADPPVVLMPRLTNNARSFGGLIHAGLNKGRRVLTLDLRGRGLSGKTGTGDLLKPSLNRLDKVFPSWDAYLQLARGMPFIDGYWDQCIEDHYQADAEIRADGSVKPRTPPVLPSKNALETAKALPNGRYVRVLGNHLTMILGENATKVVEEITRFVEM